MALAHHSQAITEHLPIHAAVDIPASGLRRARDEEPQPLREEGADH